MNFDRILFSLLGLAEWTCSTIFSYTEGKRKTSGHHLFIKTPAYSIDTFSHMDLYKMIWLGTKPWANVKTKGRQSEKPHTNEEGSRDLLDEGRFVSVRLIIDLLLYSILVCYVMFSVN
ncbi:hypothetical protein CEXT_723171 [Caerostris extrusa]|uniref:Uncharacterized protein n=1 Tax=Caerostris extrusa TaxID=172846 RepID=A0AAV4XX68_CAEEX|nr:hypothetical protein CEXT_723171 [Caerostris extrusa]